MNAEIIPAKQVRERVVNILETRNQQTGQYAVNYALNLFEKRSDSERNYKVSKSDKNGNLLIYEIDPYADRIESLLKKYFRLKESDRQTIKDARAENVFWRGDNIPEFLKIWDETNKMRDVGIEAYRETSLAEMRKLFDHIGQSHGTE